ncbi:MAG TPA: thiamine phosphate synthase [Terriglobales bacterium]
MLLYYITDRRQFSGTEVERRTILLQKIAGAAQSGVDFIQLREKGLPARELEELAREAMQIVRTLSATTRLLINSRSDVALAVGADGVHLRSADISPRDARDIWRKAGSEQDPVIAVSCHTEAEVAMAARSGANFAAFGPVFEKKDAPDPPAGIDLLRSACEHELPVLALGGVTIENASLCVRAGATGIAGIRLFQEGDLAQAVAALRTF